MGAMDRKASLFYVETSPDEDDAALGAAETWLEKWAGRYKIVKDDGQHNEIILEQHMYCTQEALDDIPDAVRWDSEWSRGEISEDDLLYGEAPRSKHREKQIRNLKSGGKA